MFGWIGLLLVSKTPCYDQTRFLVTLAAHAGINNLPKDLSARIAQALGSADPTDGQQAPLADWVAHEVAEQARKSGYGNGFEAIRAYVPWRVALYSRAGAPFYPNPRPGDPLTATVVGPDGVTSASGAGEIHTNRLGRIRIRFDFQAPEAQTQPANTSNASTWVRVMQRHVDGGMGWQFAKTARPTRPLWPRQQGCTVTARPISGAGLTRGQPDASGHAHTPKGRDTRCTAS